MLYNSNKYASCILHNNSEASGWYENEMACKIKTYKSRICIHVYQRWKVMKQFRLDTHEYYRDEFEIKQWFVAQAWNQNDCWYMDVLFSVPFWFWLNNQCGVNVSEIVNIIFEIPFAVRLGVRDFLTAWTAYWWPWSVLSC